MTDTTHTIWRSAARFFSGTMLSRISGLFRDIAMAYAFGTQSSIAAFLVAFRFAHLLRRLLGEGAMQSALIPYFEDLKKKDPKVAGRFFLDLGFSLSLLLLILIVLIMCGLGLAIGFISMNSGNREILWLTLIMMPSLLFICLFGINASFLQCEKKYFTSSIAPVIFNFSWIAGVFLTSHLPPSSAMTALSLFIIFGCFAQWAVTLPEARSILKTFQIKHFWQDARFFSDHVLKLSKPLILGIFGIAAAQINNALDAVFARWASEEGPAVLWYAIRLQQLPLALFGIAISGALLPPLTRTIKNGDYAKYQQFLDFAIRNSLALMLPITAFLYVLGECCILILFGHGDFSGYSILNTTHALWGYTFGLLPMTLILVIAPAFYANHNYYTPSMAAGFSMILNIILNTLMVPILGLGAASVAWATSISAWINFAWLLYVLIHKNHELSFRLFTPSLIKFFTKTTLLSFAAAMSCILINISITDDFSFFGFSKILFWNQQPFLKQIIQLSIGVLIFGIFCTSQFVTHLMQKEPPPNL
jgi:putative peptidoglycan lipid II flippase